MAPQLHAQGRGRKLILVLLAAGLSTTAYAQASAPPQARPGPLVDPGVGGCIYARVSDGARKLILGEAAAGRALPPALAAEVQRVAPACTKLPLTPANRPLWAAATGLFVRNGLAARLGAAHGPSQREVDEAWRKASPDDQTPFLTAARTWLDGGQAQLPEVSALEPFRAYLRQKGRFSPQVAQALTGYLYETALAEVAETRLAGQAPKTPS